MTNPTPHHENSRPVSSTRFWDRAADQYARCTDIHVFHESIYLPVIDAMAGSLHNKILLDAGCGSGDYAKKSARAGATVLAFDGSGNMIRIARAKNADPSIMYAVADLTRPLPVRSRSVDRVVANMLLMDIPEIDTCIAEFSRVLKKDGRFIFSIVHPAFFCSDWAGDESGPRAYKMVRDYLHEKTEPLEFWGTTLHYHRPLSSYFRALERAGLCVVSLEEPAPKVSSGETDPCILSHLRVPSFLVVMAAHVHRD